MKSVTREEVYKMYVKEANRNGCKGWYFMPSNCKCHYCGFDFFKKYGESLGKMFPTGCPSCHKSFVD